MSATMRIRITPSFADRAFLAHPLIPEGEYSAGQVIEIPATDAHGQPVTEANFEGILARVEILSDAPPEAPDQSDRIAELEAEVEAQRKRADAAEAAGRAGGGDDA